MNKTVLLAFLAALGAMPARGASPPALPPSFDRLDVNGDGYLTPDEVAGNPALRDFRGMDLDGDGKISRREYLSALGLQGQGPSTFDLLDANHDGRLDADEASRMPPLAQQFEATDTDRNGFVDPTEFSAFEAARERR